MLAPFQIMIGVGSTSSWRKKLIFLNTHGHTRVPVLFAGTKRKDKFFSSMWANAEIKLHSNDHCIREKMIVFDFQIKHDLAKMVFRCLPDEIQQ